MIHGPDSLSPWWKRSVILILSACFIVLIGISIKAYTDAPPIPEKVIDASGEILFTADDILSGQEVFLKYGLMQNGSIWGHGAYLGPDFSAEYLHTLATHAAESVAQQQYQRGLPQLQAGEKAIVYALVGQMLKENRYDARTGTLLFTSSETFSYQNQKEKWKNYFAETRQNRGLLNKAIQDPRELDRLTAFFAWTAWASVAKRPGRTYSYTNNFPYDPMAGNRPTTAAFLWSALSLITLLAGTAAVLFAFGKFGYLGWKAKGEHFHPQMLPGIPTESQRATIKYFAVAALLFFVQVNVGGATAHFRADPSSFYGFDLSFIFPSNLMRTWHLQLAILWVATAWVAGGLFLASSLGEKEPKGQKAGIDVLFWALVIVVFGSLLGEMAGMRQLLGKAWFWFGDQGWEYLDLGRGWQILLVIGLCLWLLLIFRAVKGVLNDPEKGEVSWLFLLTTLTIPLFYLPAMFFTGRSNFTVVDNWRFWIIHLWVEGFFELSATTMVAVLFYRLDMISRQTVLRIIYLDAILFLGAGIIGTGHHWYWTGQSNINMALSALFSAMEVVPLTLMTLDAWDFIKLSHGKCDICGKQILIPHRWTFYFLMSVGFWNFVGAGIFGFLINLPIVSYFEVGTVFTPNHAHSAFMGVFGMLGVSFIVFALRQISTDGQWARTEKYVKVSFFGLNGGLALMVLLNLFPEGVLQLLDVLNNGYWHARNVAFQEQPIIHFLEWLRLPADLIFIFLGALPLLIAAVLSYVSMRRART
jgi:nitric oxide reductase subunit B